MKNILLIEDDLDYAKIISDVLTKVGYNITHTSDGLNAINLAKEEDFDLILCDLYLENIQGTQIIEMIKMYRPEIKALMLSNSNDVDDELKSFRGGANDFIKKDSTFEVILARVKNALNTGIQTINFQELTSEAENIYVDINERIVKKDNEPVHLTNLEFDLLVYMLQNKNKLLSREKLLEDVWKITADSGLVDYRTVDAHIKNLRNKLALTSIFSVRGIGYRWYE